MDTYADELGKKLAEAEAEIERLNRLMAGDMATVRMQLDGFDVQHWSARLLALSFYDSLGDSPNYMQLEFSLPEKEPVVVTIRRKRGKYPEEVWKEKCAALEAENSALRRATGEETL